MCWSGSYLFWCNRSGMLWFSGLSTHRSSSMAWRNSALFFCLGRWKYTYWTLQRLICRHYMHKSSIMWHISAHQLFTTNNTLHSQFLKVLPVFVHQHVADATADPVFRLSDFLQHQLPLGLLSPLLLVDPLLQTLLLLNIRQIIHSKVAEINTKHTHKKKIRWFCWRSAVFCYCCFIVNSW